MICKTIYDKMYALIFYLQETDLMYYGYKISDETAALARQAEEDLKETFAKIEENSLIC